MRRIEVHRLFDPPKSQGLGKERIVILRIARKRCHVMQALDVVKQLEIPLVYYGQSFLIENGGR